MAANAVFQQILRGPCGLELLEGPFQHQLSEIAELSLLASSKLLSSDRRACRTRRLSCAFHSPIAQPLTYDAKHLEAKRALAVDEAFDEAFER